MGKLNYLKNNLKWAFKRENYSRLIATPLTVQELYLEAEMLLRAAPTGDGSVNLDETRCALDAVALSLRRTDNQKQLYTKLAGFEKAFSRAYDALFDAKPLPKAGALTRVEAIVELFVKATQLCYTPSDLARFKQFLTSTRILNTHELAAVDGVLTLYKVRYFVAVYNHAAKADSDFFVSRFFDTDDIIKARYADSTYYSQTKYRTKNLFSVLDCFGNSSVIFMEKRTGTYQSARIEASGRNIFDTFSAHKYGKKTANFAANSPRTQLSMQYYAAGNREVRNYTFTTAAKNKQKYTFSVNCGLNTDTKSQLNYFKKGEVDCLGVAGHYIAFAVVGENVTPCCTFDENGVTAAFNIVHTVTLGEGGRHDFSVVTIYADSIAELNRELNDLERFGYLKCGHLTDTAVNGEMYSQKTNVTAYSGLRYKTTPALPSRAISYTYQFGGCDVATFMDNNGNSATLIDGFAFGIEGENIYTIAHNVAHQLNSGDYVVTQDGFRQGSGSSVLTVAHSQKKTYTVTTDTPKRVVASFAFEEKSTVKQSGNTFEITSANRHIKLVCDAAVESFTTNGIEFNKDRLRYKLSGDLTCGQCIAVVFKPSTDVTFSLVNCNVHKLGEPLLSESLISTYLNFCNDKNMFCIVNKLKPTDSLTVAALAYTNTEFLKEYILKLERSTFINNFSTEYYDNSAKLKTYVDKLQYALAVTYYVAFADGGDFLTDTRLAAVKDILFDTYEGKNVCIQALALRKFAELNINKVDVLGKYCALKNVIVADKTLYSYAQAIGAVPMVNPTKQRLRDLCNAYSVPKAWYYVAQIENIYGLKVNKGVITLRPAVSADSVLEEFVLSLSGRRIKTTFERAAMQSVVLNGTTYFSGVSTNALSEDNTLVVKY
jgi:hypothetical protein